MFRKVLIIRKMLPCIYALTSNIFNLTTVRGEMWINQESASQKKLRLSLIVIHREFSVITINFSRKLFFFKPTPGFIY